MSEAISSSLLSGDALQSLRVPAIQHGAGVVQALVRLAGHAQDHAIEAGPEAEDVARLHLYAVGVEHAHQGVVADLHARRLAEVAIQVDQHPAALHAVGGHGVDAEGAWATTCCRASMITSSPAQKRL